MLLHSDLTGEVLAASRVLYNCLGPGLPESVYHKALEIELRDREVAFASEVEYQVYWRKHPVGTYHADLVIGGLVIVELKSVENLARIHDLQTLTYLRVSGIPVGLLVNFGGERLEVKRFLGRTPSLNSCEECGAGDL